MAWVILAVVVLIALVVIGVAMVARWKDMQANLVDEPAPAVARADRLIGEAMRERGYPVDDFDQRASDLSVDYPDTEDLRRAMVHCRSLFERLVEPAEVAMGAER